MQPKTLAIIITILPLLISNAVYLLSAYEEHIPWCIPYIDGCTTISRAARSGNSIYLFRPTMIAYAVLLIWFWIMTKQWLSQLYGHTTKAAHIITWLGIIGAIFLIIYIDFLGTTGEINRFMRRHGIMIFFTFTPLAQLLLLNQHYKSLPFLAEKDTFLPVLKYQLIVLILMLMIGITSIVLDIAQIKTDKIENIVEWNFSLLLNMYFLGMVFIWKNFRSVLRTGATNG
jgi:hypothetical protein